MSFFTTLGISKTAIREENDFYATDPKAMYKLLEHETFNKSIWEPACGEGNLSKVLKEKGYNVYSTDLIDRGYQDDTLDFLKSDNKWFGDIITNPPFKLTTEFIIKSLASIEDGNKVAMFLKINHLTGKNGLKRFIQNILLQRFMFLQEKLLVVRIINLMGLRVEQWIIFG